MKFRTGTRNGKHVVESLSENGNWIRCAGPFKHKSSASGKCKRMRENDKVSLRSTVGQQLMSGSWGNVDLGKNPL